MRRGEKVMRFSSSIALVCLLLAGQSAAIAQTDTTTTITNIDPAGPITIGSSTTVSVSVTGSGGTPTGSVTVSDGTGASCPITLSAGAGNCDLTPLTTGTKSVTAQYLGDANFLGSTSAPSTLLVSPPARTVTASGNSNGSISPPSQYVTDGNTASFNVTVSDGYTAVIDGTCPAGTLSHGVYTSGSITGDCAVTASFVSAESVLNVQVSDDHLFARYGSLLQYVVTVSNSAGIDVHGLAISAAASPDLDSGSGQWTCFGSNSQCQTTGQGVFADNAVTVPGKGNLSWLISVPALANAPDATVDYTISLNGAPFATPKTDTDTDTFVLFHDSFDVPYGDGAQ